MSCVKIAALRTRCKVLTWQELSEALPRKLQQFLDHKYGIVPPGHSPSPWGESEPDPKQNAPHSFESWDVKSNSPPPKPAQSQSTVSESKSGR
jgi:hypothetical protein